MMGSPSFAEVLKNLSINMIVDGGHFDGNGDSIYDNVIILMVVW